MGEKYWTQIVLKSVGLADKPTYNLREVAIMLDCSKMTLWRMIKKGEINVSKNKKVYREELLRYFDNCLLKDDTCEIEN